jgi:hypothetical protein
VVVGVVAAISPRFWVGQSSSAVLSRLASFHSN